MGRQPDLVRDSKLETEICNGRTIHTFREPDLEKIEHVWQEQWEDVQQIGIGGFGRVLLQRCTAENKAKELRAVKQIFVASRRSASMEYIRELEATAKFSNKRVWVYTPLATC